jgi:hypothetical protein
VRPLTETEIRESFVNGSAADARQLALPLDYLLIEWDHIDVLSWRDPKLNGRGYIVTLREDRPVGIILRAAESSMSHHRSTMCNLCQTLQPANQVSLFSARRAGERGERGDSVGTYVCADLSCPENVRLAWPLAPQEIAPGGQHAARIEGMLRRTEALVDSVLAA